MGGCFSSGSYEEAGCRPTRVRPSDEEGMWPYVGERDVDSKVGICIANFHRHQSGCAEMPPTPAPAPAPAAY